MFRKQLNKLAARILKGQVRGVVAHYDSRDGYHYYRFVSFYGDNWQVSVPVNTPKFTRLPSSTLDGQP